MGSAWSAAELARLQAKTIAPRPRTLPDGTDVPPPPPRVTSKRKRAIPRHLEDDMQAACVKWFRCQYPHLAGLLFAIPNGGNRSAREGARLKKQGVTSGVPDVLLAVPIPGYAGLFIELKVGRNTPSPEQAAMMARLSVMGYRCAVVYSLAEFMAEIKAYLGGK